MKHFLGHANSSKSMGRLLFTEQCNTILPLNVCFIYALLNECAILLVLHLTFVKVAPINSFNPLRTKLNSLFLAKETHFFIVDFNYLNVE
jgi:hypothetical protein